MAELFLVKSEAREAPAGAPPDWRERERALNVRASWIVEAPAGSGKTGLLLQRFLKLLADESVTEPEQVMAITFTVKATAELRERVLHQLRGAARHEMTRGGFEAETRELAEAALRRDAALGWGLLERPERLSIRTIDSVCAEIAGSLPVLSGSGGRLAPVLDAGPLYRRAAGRTLMQLGGGDTGLDAALRTVLLHRDGNLTDCERLLAGMLAWRDQWGDLVPLTGEALTDEALDAEVLPRLERALDQAICAGLTQLAKSISPPVLQALVFLASEMGNSAGYKGAPSPVALCAGLDKAPGETAEHLDHWRALIHLITTKETGWRRLIARNHLGFEIEKHHSERLKELVDHLSQADELLQPMRRVKNLPPAKYPPEQWMVAKALFRMLQRALVELQLVFAERGECDFTELGLLARTALGRDAQGDDLAAALGMRLQHLLVDEMQDTSTSQYTLIELLTQGWDGQSQTVFLVGDPKQSIYLFRQARVERFVRTMRTGRLGELPVGSLRLAANFRSQGGLVQQGNEDFSRLFPALATPLHPEDVPFVAAVAVREETETEGRVWHPAVLPPDSDKKQQARADALKVREIFETWRAKPLPPGRTKPWSMAVLVRARGHLAEIVTALREDSGMGPVLFRAVEIELLGERQEVLDLFALTRALQHPADRVAWLAILRAPWCGLTLADLHLLTGADEDGFAEATVGELLDQRGDLLSPDGCQRLERVWTVMQAASRQRGHLTTAQVVERSWRSLGGDAWLGPGERANAERYLQLLDQLEDEGAGDGVDLEQLDLRLKTLYAEAAVTPGAVDLMTIHGAKGLEWDVVVVPALERRGQATRGRLLTWMELDSADTESAHVVLAPILGKGEASRELNAWLNSMASAREAAERKRLLYVACTRAREELHLFASPEATLKGEISVAADSLLRAAWPAAKEQFRGVPESPKVVRMPAIVHFDESFALAAASDEAKEERPALLRRVPPGFDFAGRLMARDPLRFEPEEAGESGSITFERPEGSFAARSFGNAIHAFLDLLAERVTAGCGWDELMGELPQWLPRVTAVLRGNGLPPAMVERLSQRVLLGLENVLRDGTGRWVIAAHPAAASERALTAWRERRESVRFDRIFRAGSEPGRDGSDCLWVVDFKTAAHGRDGWEEFLRAEKERYMPQMEAYAHVLGASEIRMMLYYPMIPAMNWWVTGNG